MSTRKIKDAKDLRDGSLIYFKGHAKATYMSDGSTVEDAINAINQNGGGSGSTDLSDYETKLESQAKLQEAKDYTDARIAELQESVVTQTIELAKGYNWISFYVKTSLQDLQSALGNKAISIETSDDGTGDWNIKAEYNTETNTWSGNLIELSPILMYSIQCSESCSIELKGALLNPSELEYTLAPGLTLINYPLDKELSITEALAGLSCVDGDRLKSKVGESVYYSDFGWDGFFLQSMIPGKGYTYYNSSQETKTFVYPTELDIELSDYAKKTYVDDEVQKAKDYTDEKLKDITVEGGTSAPSSSFTDSECRAAFINEMTVLSKKLGAKNSTWTDPTGIENKSTALDMCKILVHASGYEKLYDIWNTPSWEATKVQEDGSVVKATITSSVVSNVASPQLTDYYNVMGGKTGTLNRHSTNNLGVIMQSVKYQDRIYAVIVMQADTDNSGSGNRFVATKEVMDILENKSTTTPPTTTSPLDEIAYENLTWRQIFIKNNYAPNINNGVFTSNKAETYSVSSGNCTIVTDDSNADNYVPPYSLDVSGTTSCQLKSNKVTVGELYLIACNVNVSAYTAGYCGTIIGSGSTGATVNRVTEGWEAITQRVIPETTSKATLYVGSASSSNLSGKVNNPVIIPASIFNTVPDESTWQQLFEEYNQKLIEDMAIDDNEQNGSNNEDITLPEPQASYICACILPRLPRAFQYLPLTPLYQKNANTEWYPASMSKILTGILVLDYVPDLYEKITVTQEDVDALTAFGSGWYANDILVGETVTYLDLLYAMFLPSSNIATQIVCRGVGEKILRSKNL